MFTQDGVFRMSLSPDSTVLAVIHFSGSLSLWNIPSFKLRGSWKQEEQVIKSLLCVRVLDFRGLKLKCIQFCATILINVIAKIMGVFKRVSQALRLPAIG